MTTVERVFRRVDAFQQARHPVAIAFAVIKKLGDDRASSLAALLAYYGLLTVFPLLLLLTTIMGFVMDSDSALRRAILRSALRDFPIVGQQLSQSIHPLRGNAFALIVGIVGMIWGSLGVTKAAQLAMAEVWNIPVVDRPALIPRLIRGVGLLGVFGVGTAGSTMIAAVVAIGRGAAPTGISVALTVALNVGLFLLAFRVLTVREVETRALVPGAIGGGVCWSALQMGGVFLIGHQLRHASQVYGYFASVLGLLSWLYLGAQLTLYAAETNAVLARRLWPRSILRPPLTDADKQATRL